LATNVKHLLYTFGKKIVANTQSTAVFKKFVRYCPAARNQQLQ